MTSETGVLLRQYAARIHNAEEGGPDTDELLLGALVTRDSLAKAVLTPDEEAELGTLDAALVALCSISTSFPDSPSSGITLDKIKLNAKTGAVTLRVSYDGS